MRWALLVLASAALSSPRGSHALSPPNSPHGSLTPDTDSPPSDPLSNSFVELAAKLECPDSITCPPDRLTCSEKLFFNADTVRLPEWGPCPRQPRDRQRAPCKRAVLGRFYNPNVGLRFQTRAYMNCPGYVVLDSISWTQQLNDDFVACCTGLYPRLGKHPTSDLPWCPGKQAIHVVSPTGIVDEGSVTFREICQLQACMCQLNLFNGQHFDVDCSSSENAT